MKYRYFKETITNEEIGEYEAYGIVTEDGNYRYSDVSCDEDEVKKIVNVLNENDVDPIHLHDVIEDMIG